MCKSISKPATLSWDKQKALAGRLYHARAKRSLHAILGANQGILRLIFHIANFFISNAFHHEKRVAFGLEYL